MAFRPGGPRAGRGRKRGLIQYSDPTEDGDRGSLDVGRKNAGVMRYSGDGERLLIAFADGAVEEWRVSDGTRVRVMEGPPLTFPAIISPDGRFLAMPGPADAPVVRSLDPGTPPPVLQGGMKDIRFVSISPDSRYLTGTSRDGRGVDLEPFFRPRHQPIQTKR